MAICWASRRSKVVAISSTEAEVIAGVAAAKDIKFMRAILTFMWEEITGTIPLFIDNEGMWFNTRNVGVSARTRYWELWQQFVRECYVNGILSPYLIERNDEVADIMTHATAKEDPTYKLFRNYALNHMQS